MIPTTADLLRHPRVKDDRELVAIIAAMRDADRFERLSRSTLSLYFGLILGRFSLVLDALDAALAPVDIAVSDLHDGDDGDGPLESTDLHLTGRGLSWLVNLPVGSQVTFALSVDGTPQQNGAIGTRGPETSETPETSALLTAFHAMWSRHVGTPGYVKDDWMALAEAIRKATT